MQVLFICQNQTIYMGLFKSNIIGWSSPASGSGIKWKWTYFLDAFAGESGFWTSSIKVTSRCSYGQGKFSLRVRWLAESRACARFSWRELIVSQPFFSNLWLLTTNHVGKHGVRYVLVRVLLVQWIVFRTVLIFSVILIVTWRIIGVITSNFEWNAYFGQNSVQCPRMISLSVCKFHLPLCCQYCVVFF